MFSDITTDWPSDWTEAFAECELYGGWLVNIADIKEQNCLMTHASAQNYNTWYWTGGKNLILMIQLIEKHYLAHVEETPGVFVSSSGEPLEWYYPKWTCDNYYDYDGHGRYNTVYGGGDAFMIYLGDHQLAGAWCDWHKDQKHYFICEGLI